MTAQAGILYVVPTPIGNLADMTPRALEVLADVAVIAAEDTRHSARLMQHFSIKTPMQAYHEHNEREQTPRLLLRLEAGESVALISDAGTPLVSDPGYRLVHEARLAGVQVVPLPGACALIAALSASGLPSDRFIFEGFLPAKSAARRQCLQDLVAESRTLIFYESTHRIKDCLDDMLFVFGPERDIVLARELSKKFETIHGAPLADLVVWLSADDNQQRGEFVLLVKGAARAEAGAVDAEAERVLRLLMAELPLKQAAALTAQLTGGKKNALYKYALSLE